MIKKIILALGTTWMISGCTGIQPEKQESAFIVIKSEKMKYADMGFIYNSASNVKIDIYAAGQSMVQLDINAQNICMSLFKCMEKKDFNEQFLHAAYPETLLENIFRAKPIFNQEGLIKTVEGFTQNIKKEALYDITYSVVSGGRTFRDRINNILIKVREQ
ncbi:hypothetical protein KKC13_10330 [bacterium]|nr:hypothetical protein [bacterium]MBU1957413.1 hypothetical protein [bacterium]